MNNCSRSQWEKRLIQEFLKVVMRYLFAGPGNMIAIYVCFGCSLVAHANAAPMPLAVYFGPSHRAKDHKCIF